MAICFFFIIIGLIINNSELMGLSSYPMTITILLGFYLLLKNGTFINTRLYRFISLSIAVLIVGTMFKIMHWPGSSFMIIIGIGSILIFYMIHFLKKNNKNLIDYGKAFVLTLILSARLINFFHFAYGYELLYLSYFVFISFTFYYIIVQIKSPSFLSQ